MKHSKRRALRPLTGLVAAVCIATLLAGSAFAVNEATDGALVQSIHVWLNGQEAETTLVSIGDGTYDVVADGEAIGTVTEDEDSVAFRFDSDEDDGSSIEMEWSYSAGDGTSDSDAAEIPEDGQ